MVAHVLSRSVRAGEIEAADALRILRHELRRRNTNSALRIAQRSQGARKSIDKYAPDPPPKNGSPDALHADHVFPLTEARLTEVDGIDGWVVELERLRLSSASRLPSRNGLQKPGRTHDHVLARLGNAG